MELVWNTSQPIKFANLQTTITVNEGQALKIETSPDGEEIINAVCPSGKTWLVNLNLFVEETD